MFKVATMIGIALLITLIDGPVMAAPDSSWVTSKYRQGDFKLVSTGRVASILIAPDDFKVVRIAADNLATDVGVRPSYFGPRETKVITSAARR